MVRQHNLHTAHPPIPRPHVSNTGPDADLSGVPLGPLTENRSWSCGGIVPGYKVVKTAEGVAFRASRGNLFFGLTVLAAAATGAILAPTSVWHEITKDDFICPGFVKVAGILMSLALGGGGPIAAYLYMRSKRPHVLFDRRHGRVVDINGVADGFPLSELLAVQVCRNMHLDRKNLAGSDSHELLLVRKCPDGQIMRHLLMRTMEAGRTRKMARRISEAMGVPLMDCTQYD